VKRYRSCLTASVCLGLLTALSACDDDHGGYYPPPPVVPTGDGAGPDGLIQGQDGNFYGTTVSGGLNGLGTVFKITPTGTESLVYSFAGGAANGATPQGLVQGSDGNFYGATSQGGSGPCQGGCGAVFKLTPTGVQTGLYFFSGGSDGGVANGLVQGSDGNFYGTTAYGGVTNSQCGPGGCGVVFKLTPVGIESALYSFVAGSADGALPNASVMQGTDGNFYGTTIYGGASNDGTAFKVTPAGVETVLHSFAGGTDGALPQTPLTEGSDGNFYGTTPNGGVNGFGTVFKLTPAGAETVLYSFAGGTGDGAIPGTGLIQGSDGNFYGTTNSGGNSGCFNGCGVLFKITPAGAESVLYLFTASTGSGAQAPAPSSLIQGSDGNFYVATFNGGQFGAGALYKITPSGAATVLYSFGTNNP
jgi:uncharacterized repeat protein (TIGR03803 family)